MLWAQYGTWLHHFFLNSHVYLPLIFWNEMWLLGVWCLLTGLGNVQISTCLHICQSFPFFMSFFLHKSFLMHPLLSHSAFTLALSILRFHPHSVLYDSFSLLPHNICCEIHVTVAVCVCVCVCVFVCTYVCACINLHSFSKVHPWPELSKIGLCHLEV